MAFEKHEGPVGPQWRDETMAEIHELLQRLSYLQGAAHFTDRKHKRNPVNKPKHFPRPYELFREKDQPDQNENDQEDPVGSTFGGAEEGGDHGDDREPGVPHELDVQR